MSQQGRLIDLPSSLETLTGNSGGAVSPDGAGNINVVGSAPIDVTGNPGTFTLTIDTDGTLATDYVTDSGTAHPAADVINILGGTGIDTSGAAATVTIAASADVATLYTADSGIATPAANNLNIIGGTNVTTSGAGATITVNANTASQVVNLTAVSSGPYVVLSTDYYISADVSGGAFSVQLPDAPSTGRVIIVKDSTGSASSFNLTVTTVGGVVNIDGGTSFVMNTPYESANFIFNGSSYEIF